MYACTVCFSTSNRFKLTYEQAVYQNLVMFELFNGPQSCLCSFFLFFYFLRYSYSTLYIDTLKLHEEYSNIDLLLIWLLFVVLIYKPFMSKLQLLRHSIDSDNSSSSVSQYHSCPEFIIIWTDVLMLCSIHNGKNVYSCV